MAGTRWTPWDVGYFHNPKARAAGKNGRALHLASTCWSADNLQDGKVPAGILGLLCSLAEVPRTTATRLVEVGLWEPLDDGTGWMIHDFLEHNKSKADVENARHKWARKKAEQRGMSPGDSNGDINGHVTECPPGSPPYKTKTDRQTDTTRVYISEKTDDSTTGQPSSSSNGTARQTTRNTLALAAAKALANKRTDLTRRNGWVKRTAEGLLTERLDEIDRCIDQGYTVDAAVELLTSTPGEQPLQAAWHANPNCEFCEGEGFVKDDNGFLIECTCRRRDPFPAKQRSLRSVT